MSLIDPISVPPPAACDARTVAGPHHGSGLFPGRDRLRVRLLRVSRLSRSDRHAWAALSAHAAAGNIFAADWLMGPALRQAGQGARLAVVEDGAGTWLGTLPLHRAWLPGRWPLPAIRSFAGGLGGSGAPLLRPGTERTFWGALLAHLDRHPGRAAGFLAEALPLDEPAGLALVSLCAEQRRLLYRCGDFARPARITGRAGDPRTAAAQEQQLDALEARLAADHGPVRLVLHRRAGECELWLAAFLALERGGGALVSRTDAAALGVAIREGHRRGALRLASLTAGETIVAMTAWLVADGRGYALGTAFDTRLGDFAPDRLLLRRVMRLAAIEALSRFDGPAQENGSEPDPLWPERRSFAQLAVAIGGPRRRALFGRLMREWPRQG